MIKKNGNGWGPDWKVIFSVVVFIGGLIGNYFATTNDIKTSVNEVKLKVVQEIGEVKTMIRLNEMNIQNVQGECNENKKHITKVADRLQEHEIKDR